MYAFKLAVSASVSYSGTFLYNALFCTIKVAGVSTRSVVHSAESQFLFLGVLCFESLEGASRVS